MRVSYSGMAWIAEVSWNKYMFDVVRKEIEWGGRPLIFETGRVARQADGAVLVTYGETTALCTVVGAKEPRVGLDFFPLTNAKNEDKSSVE